MKIPDRLPLLGPLDVEDYDTFVEKSKREFYSLWEKRWVESSSLTDFTPLKKLGSGSFGIVFLVKHNTEGMFLAQKTIEKGRVVKTKQIEHTRNELNILKSLNYPFTLHLEYFFKDNSYLHFITPFISGGELFYHLRAAVKFEEHVARFFSAQIILCIEYLHKLDVVYRDLKPENILIDQTGYLKLADFGFARIIKTRTYTLCGTPEYLAPEIILNKGYGKSVDWWAIGVLLYELVAGKSPFYQKKSMDMYEKAASGKFFMPNYFSPELQDLVKNILQPDVSRRYGILQNGSNDVKNHKWFRTIEWLNLFNRKLKAPYVPKEICTDYNETMDQKYQLKTATIEQFAKEFETF